ncbi:MAG TPA: EamA family transporter [Thermoanaerobaculia bacterium]
MTLALRLGAMIFAGIFVALADALLKKIAVDERRIFANPWMIAVVLLYVGQIAFFLYVFIKKMELGIAGNLQMVAYSVATVLLSVGWFREKLTVTQLVGIALAVIGSILMVREA